VDKPAKNELLAEYANYTVDEVYEFKMIPEIDYGETDWDGCLMSCGPRYRLEESIFGVRVLISKNAPKEAVLTALKRIVSDLESCEHLAAQQPSRFAALSTWFDK
jgi:hypothetical protein